MDKPMEHGLHSKHNVLNQSYVSFRISYNITSGILYIKSFYDSLNICNGLKYILKWSGQQRISFELQ